MNEIYSHVVGPHPRVQYEILNHGIGDAAAIDDDHMADSINNWRQ